jgi:non-ribosomal peptide synthetase component F
MCQDPDMPLSSLQLVSETDRGHLLGPSWFELRPDLAAGPSVIAAFESQAARQPHARCLVYEGDSMTYEQVSEWVLLLQACLIMVVTNDARQPALEPYDV